MKIYDYICKIEVFLARISLLSMVVLIFAAGVARVLRHPINWAMDISTFLFAWSCFLSADIAWRENKLMSVDIFINKLPEKARKIIRLINYIILIGFLIYIIIFGFWLSYTTRDRAFQGIPGFSYTWPTLSLPVASVLILITTILKIKKEFKKEKSS
ncbi:MAG: TRAP transporter small permease [Spirochaetes bacterium]|nr:TRAP transporter small permease [Spirochaetota bacterium]